MWSLLVLFSALLLQTSSCQLDPLDPLCEANMPQSTTSTLPEAPAGKKKILFVVSHPNVGKSFSHLMVEAAKTTLEAEGHVVVVSDLVASGFNPIGGPHDFKTIKDPDFFDYQMEQKNAAISEDPNAGFVDEIQREMDRLAWCDTVIHQFPIYWWSLPAVHKGWFDRVLAYYWCYGGGLETLRGKEWMLSLTTGGPTSMQLNGGWPVPNTNSIPSHLQPFWVATPGMLKCTRLPLFIAGGPGKFDDTTRAKMIQEYVDHVRRYVSRSLSPADAPKQELTASVHHHVTKSVCIVGATGGLGSEIVRQALAAGLTVSGVIRSEEKAQSVFSEEERKQLTLHVGSIDDAAFLAEAFSNVDAVVEVISNSQRPAGVQKIFEAAAASHVTTVVGVGGAVTLFTDPSHSEESRIGLLNLPGSPDWMPAVTKLHIEVRKLALSFVGKGIKYTAQVAPPFMEAGASTHKYVPLEDVVVKGRSPEKVTYGDTAQIFLEVLSDPAVWSGKQVGLVAN